MGTVNATIAGRQFRLACEDGQEQHLEALAHDIDQRIIDLRARFGEIGDTRLTVMAALMVADEMNEMTRKMRRCRGRRLQLGRRTAGGHYAQAQPDLAGGTRRRYRLTVKILVHLKLLISDKVFLSRLRRSSGPLLV